MILPKTCSGIWRSVGSKRRADPRSWRSIAIFHHIHNSVINSHRTMATLVARIALPTTRANLFSTCARGARLGLFIGSTGLLGAHALARPATMMTQCQGTSTWTLSLMRCRRSSTAISIYQSRSRSSWTKKTSCYHRFTAIILWKCLGNDYGLPHCENRSAFPV